MDHHELHLTMPFADWAAPHLVDDVAASSGLYTLGPNLPEYRVPQLSLDTFRFVVERFFFGYRAAGPPVPPPPTIFTPREGWERFLLLAAAGRPYVTRRDQAQMHADLLPLDAQRYPIVSAARRLHPPPGPPADVFSAFFLRFSALLLPGYHAAHYISQLVLDRFPRRFSWGVNESSARPPNSVAVDPTLALADIEALHGPLAGSPVPWRAWVSAFQTFVTRLALVQATLLSAGFRIRACSEYQFVEHEPAELHPALFLPDLLLQTGTDCARRFFTQLFAALEIRGFVPLPADCFSAQFLASLSVQDYLTVVLALRPLSRAPHSGPSSAAGTHGRPASAGRESNAVSLRWPAASSSPSSTPLPAPAHR